VVAPGLTGAAVYLYQSLTANLMNIGRPLIMLDGVVQAPVLEEVAKGTGILLLALVGRRWCTDLVGGLVLGAAAGLGFNFLETVLYMSDPTKDGASFQHWLRQVVAIMTSHVAFSALVGAGIGAAWQSRGRRTRVAVIGCGLLTAISGHYTYNSLGQMVPFLVHVPEPVFAMVVMPLTVCCSRALLPLARRPLRDSLG
jgi:RsiW-degrading membrane proteinase PrsW (M82 family)